MLGRLLSHVSQACSYSPGSRDYARHQEAANKALPYPFASAKHFHAKNAEGEALNKSMQISSPNIRRESCKDQDPQAAYGRLGHD